MLTDKVSKRDPLQARVKSGQKYSKDVIKNVFQTSVRLCQISSQKKSLLKTTNAENKFCSLYKTLESSGEMILIMKLYLYLYNLSEL